MAALFYLVAVAGLVGFFYLVRAASASANTGSGFEFDVLSCNAVRRNANFRWFKRQVPKRYHRKPDYDNLIKRYDSLGAGFRIAAIYQRDYIPCISFYFL